jgi:hypothetical protein
VQRTLIEGLATIPGVFKFLPEFLSESLLFVLSGWSGARKTHKDTGQLSRYTRTG